MPPDVYDYHVHTGPQHHGITHTHDDHPRHHHDRLGSVIYLDECGGGATPRPVDDNPWDRDPTDVGDLDRQLTDNHIGVGGYDYTKRTG